MCKVALRVSVILIFLVSLGGCTQPGETTGVGAATGGVIGAGLGAIIGNQTGDTGAGLAIGAVAGAGTGALIGNAIEGQQEAIRNHDEAIERQDQMIRAQNVEIEELRRASGDLPSYTTERTIGIDQSPQNPSYGGYPQGANLGAQPSSGAYDHDRYEVRRPIQEKTVADYSRSANARYPSSQQGAGMLEPKIVVPDDQAGATGGGYNDNSYESQGIQPAPADGGIEVYAPPTSAHDRARFDHSTQTDGSFKSPHHVNRMQQPARVQAPIRIEQPNRVAVQGFQEPSTSMPVPKAVTRSGGGSAQKAQGGSVQVYSVRPEVSDSKECVEARDEVNEARRAGETADKLFHYRRALRLCPDHPGFHNGLGEVYLSMGRVDDARFEFEEALRLDPSYQNAKLNLDGIASRERF